MKYIILADEVAHGITAVLDAATHPEETKQKAQEIINKLKDIESYTLRELINNLNKLSLNS